MGDFKVLEVFHSFTEEPNDGWQLVSAFGRGAHVAPLSEHERHTLLVAAQGLRDRYGEQVGSGEAAYASAAARFPGRTIFVYLTLLYSGPGEARH